MGTQKLNEALGIESIESFLSSLNVDDEQLKKLGEVDEQVKNDIERIDEQMKNYSEGGIQKVDLDDIQQSLGHIKELVDISKDTIKYVYQQIVDSELVDSELVGSFSKLLEAVHIQISEYIGLYKDRQNFYGKVRLEAMKHQYKIEQMKLKNQLDIEKIERTKKNDAITVDNMSVPYSQEELIRQLDNAENANDGD